MSARALWVFALGVSVAVACSKSKQVTSGPGSRAGEAGSDGEGGSGGGGTGGSAGTAGRGGSAGKGGGNAGGSAGKSSGGSGGMSEVAGAGGDETGDAGTSSSGAGGMVALKPLPEGSRALLHVVNLVDADAAAEIDDFLINGGTPSPLQEPHLVAPLNLFLQHYVEQYDFVFLLADHDVNTNTIGRFEPVSRPPLFGTGADTEIAKPGYETNGRVKGAIAVQYFPGGFGPFAHEILHYWGNHLNDTFGFGAGLNEDWSGHWGYAGFRGELGGFDFATLRCQTPPGEQPPDCMAESNGRTRYVVQNFAPNANGVAVPYAPFELYLMGLLPRAELPDEIELLVDANRLPSTYDPNTNTIVVEAQELTSVQVDDIIDLHGEARLLPADERDFSAAFVVVSAEPVSDALLEEVDQWAAAFGNRATLPDISSFQTLTGGRATLEVRLGPRRTAVEPAPTERVPPTCDPVAQDCDPPGAGCYMNGQLTVCAINGTAQRDEPCGGDRYECAPGMECVFRPGTSESVCSPYCDYQDTTSPVYCGTICTSTILLATPEGDIITGRCIPQ